jgi:hypothetical protein
VRHLFLDDDDLRHELFAEWCKADRDQVIHVCTIKEFARALDKHDAFDKVWLDYDLNDFHYRSFTGSGETAWDGKPKRLTGYHAACKLISLDPVKRPRRVCIHSWNHVGAAEMEILLKSHSYPVEVNPFDQHKFLVRLAEWETQGRVHPYIVKVKPSPSAVL